MFYRYAQNNSGGVLVGAQYVIVEAESLEEAEARAASAGVYFDGVEKALDCECCGDRWSRYPDEFSTRDEALAALVAHGPVEGEPPLYQLVEGPADAAS